MRLLVLIQLPNTIRITPFYINEEVDTQIEFEEFKILYRM